ncbi:hypothetical protein MKZ38_001202 [Zalerion maritima]|uniref:Uncharacterized protein n=1 Tax=Zalerion maritima TaxID=339359 RepID=A0AAD5RXZ2_9PEZI|nr:hypothetical protein MKZ38_001202 [Zalerion maritima]
MGGPDLESFPEYTITSNELGGGSTLLNHDTSVNLGRLRLSPKRDETHQALNTPRTWNSQREVLLPPVWPTRCLGVRVLAPAELPLSFEPLSSFFTTPPKTSRRQIVRVTFHKSALPRCFYAAEQCPFQCPPPSIRLQVESNTTWKSVVIPGEHDALCLVKATAHDPDDITNSLRKELMVQIEHNGPEGHLGRRNKYPESGQKFHFSFAKIKRVSIGIRIPTSTPGLPR